MNHHQRLLPPGANRALRFFSLLLLALVTVRELPAMPRIFKLKPMTVATGSTTRGYLSTVGAPALRFHETPAVPAPFSAPQISPTTSANVTVPDRTTNATPVPSNPSSEAIATQE